jgi:hypothetical protein
MEAPPVQTQSPDMSHSEHPTPVSEHREESPLHEHSKIRLRTIILFLIWFIAAMIVVEVGVYVVYRTFHHVARNVNLPITGLTNAQVTHAIPPEPRLQPSINHDATEVEDLAAMHAQDLADFQKRGWVNENGQIRVDDQTADAVIQMSKPAPKRVR